MAEMLFMLFFAYILLCNGQNIAEYEVYWLMGFPIIISLRRPLAILSCKAIYQIKQL